MLLLFSMNLGFAGSGSTTPSNPAPAHQGGTMGRLGGMMVRG